MKNTIFKMSAITLFTVATAITAHAGLLDSVNSVLNQVDRVNNTADRVERATDRTVQRLPASKDNSNQTQTITNAKAGGQLGMTLNKFSYRSGEKIIVNFNAPSFFDSSAWIGVLPSNVQHGSEALNDKYDISFKKLNGSAVGTLALLAPTTAGAYDIRMHDTDNKGREVASITISVY